MKAIALVTLCFASSICRADCHREAEVAVKFMNQYLAYSAAPSNGHDKPSTEAWLASNPLAARELLVSYKAVDAAGRRQDPELGWDVDLILDAQDGPEKGFRLSQCAQVPGVVILQGVDWQAFKVAVKVGSTARGLQVVGAGMVNIPKGLRAPR